MMNKQGAGERPAQAQVAAMPGHVFEALREHWRQSFVRTVSPPVECYGAEDCRSLVVGCGVDGRSGLARLACAKHLPDGGLRFDAPTPAMPAGVTE